LVSNRLPVHILQIESLIDERMAEYLVATLLPNLFKTKSKDEVQEIVKSDILNLSLQQPS